VGDRDGSGGLMPVGFEDVTRLAQVEEKEMRWSQMHLLRWGRERRVLFIAHLRTPRLVPVACLEGDK